MIEYTVMYPFPCDMLPKNSELEAPSTRRISQTGSITKTEKFMIKLA